MYNWNEIDLLWHFEAKKKQKIQKYFDCLSHSLFWKAFFFLLKAPLDPSPSGYKSF